MPKLETGVRLNGVRKLANASKSCSTQVCEQSVGTKSGWRALLTVHGRLSQSLAYGKCIGANYQDVSKGMCAEEFKAFKDCVQVS